MKLSKKCCLVVSPIVLAHVTLAVAEQASPVSPVVVTAPLMAEPYRVITGTREPRAPLPVQDGASFLDSIPGFTQSRKAGTSGDPEFRGLGGSRLQVLADDSHLFGGCGGRMDPPTAYIFPQSYDRVELIKGPQSVRYGATSAGIVRFERDRRVFSVPTTTGYASYTAGSFGRSDIMADVTTGDSSGYARVIGTLSDQDDYRDGDGQRVHSSYNRWSGTGMLGWTPDRTTQIELSYDRSDGQAAYDDRGMDGTRFDRTGYALSASRQEITSWLDDLSLHLYSNYVDHVMDNFVLREPPAMPMISFPDRRTDGGSIVLTLSPATDLSLVAGADFAEDTHANNSARGMDALGWRSLSRIENARFVDRGIFTELTYNLSPRSRLVSGIRVDTTEVTAKRDFGGAARGDTDEDTLTSGFLRLESSPENLPVALFAGVGRTARAGDFWERRRVFDISPETLTQVDAGLTVSTGAVRASLSAFYGKFDDYILVVSPALVTSGEEAAEVRNIDATTAGAEADLQVSLSDTVSSTVTMAWVHSDNDTDDVPLAQTPPVEATLSLDYDRHGHVAGVQIRGVRGQSRIHRGYGTIYSLDTKKTSGFATASLYVGKALFADSRITVGIDNLFDRSYTNHIQRGSAELGVSSEQIHEPGRMLWANVTTKF